MSEGLDEIDTFEMLEVFSDKMKKCIKYLIAPNLSEMGLKSYHILFLLPIERNNGISQKDIRDCVPYDKSRVSMVVSELIALGLVVDERTGKKSSLHLTDDGKKACATFRSLVDRLNCEIMSALNEKERNEFLHCILLLNDRVDELIAQHDLGSGPFAVENDKNRSISD